MRGWRTGAPSLRTDLPGRDPHRTPMVRTPVERSTPAHVRPAIERIAAWTPMSRLGRPDEIGHSVSAPYGQIGRPAGRPMTNAGAGAPQVLRAAGPNDRPGLGRRLRLERGRPQSLAAW